MVCENCNTINDSNTEKCAKCGADLSNQAERDIQSSGVDVEQNIDNGQIYKSEDSAICKHCGALISKNDKLCPHCNGYVGKEDPDFPKSKRNLGIIFSGLVPVLGLIALLIFGYGLGFVWFVIAKPGLFVLFFGLAGALISYIALTVILLKYPKNSYERKSF
ncbi:MAG: zinc ribbon domain-containing protein [Clostridia bacterium]|nr:zinc ribbon domain-containing protein [Clostridia bacterium]